MSAFPFFGARRKPTGHGEASTERDETKSVLNFSTSERSFVHNRVVTWHHVIILL